MPTFLSAISRPAVLSVFAAVLLLPVLPAAACKYIERPMAEKIAAAPVIVIGAIETIENGLATLRVQQAIKGVEAGQETITFEAGGMTSCHHRFAAGQRWLYMGVSYMAGSILLEDENARRIDENIEFVAKEFGGEGARASLALGGTLTNTCAPWDGSAMAVELEGGIAAQIYAGMGDLGETPRLYTLDNRMQRGSGAIHICSAEGVPCARAAGQIYLQRAQNGDIEGRLEITEGEHTRLKMFRVKEKRTQQSCG